MRSAIRRTAKALEFSGPRWTVGAPERLSSWWRRPVKVAGARGAMSTLAELCRALESSVAGQGVDNLHGHSNPVVLFHLDGEYLIERIVPVLIVIRTLKALFS